MAPPGRLAWVLREYPFADSNGQNSWFASLIGSVSSAGFDTCIVSPDARGVPLIVADTRLSCPHMLKVGSSTSILAPRSAARRIAWRAYRCSPHHLQTRLASARRWSRSKAGVDQQVGRPWKAAEAAWLQQSLRRLDPDVVLFDGPFALVEGTGRSARVLVAPDILTVRSASLLAMGYHVWPPIDPDWEIARLREADAAVAIQWDDARWISGHAGIPVVTAPPTFPWRGAPSDGHDVLVVASGSLHNVDGVRWMIRSVWPEVAKADPCARLRVVGTVCSQLEASPGVDLVGEVADLGYEYARSALSVVPLRVGSGLKVKLAEAICHGRAVVTTAVGAEGLPELPEAPFVVANSTDAFASSVVRLLTDHKERRRLESAARSTQELFDPGHAHSALLEMVAELALASRHGTGLPRSRLRSPVAPDHLVVAELSPDEHDPGQGYI